MSKYIDKDVAEVESYIFSISKSPVHRVRDFEYKILENEVFNTARDLARVELKHYYFELRHKFATLKLVAYEKNVDVDRDFLSDIEEKISILEEQLKGGFKK